MFSVYIELMAQDEIRPRLIFSFYVCLRLASPNYAFMGWRHYSNQKSNNIQMDFPIDICICMGLHPFCTLRDHR